MRAHHRHSAGAPAGALTAGTYLRCCREAAALGLRQAAASIAALPWAVRPASPADIVRMALRLGAAEDDSHHFPESQLELVAAVIPLDQQLYLGLVELHAAGFQLEVGAQEFCAMRPGMS